MRVHHLNCISTCPLGGHLMDGRSKSVLQRGELCCHVLLIETDRCGLVLVDTGFGLRDVADPKSRLSGFFLAMLRPEFREDMTAIRQIQRLGFDPADVRHIILTHLDFDHAGGLDDFPDAAVHMLRTEREGAEAQETWLDRQRFRPQQWGTRAKWRSYAMGESESWFGFHRVHSLEGVPEDIVLVPLIGHTHGHAGVAIKQVHRWLFNTGDAYFHHTEMDVEQPRCTPGLRFYQRLMEKNRGARLWNQERLLQLRRAHAEHVEVFCSHDVLEFERLAGRSAKLPARAFERSAAKAYDRPILRGPDQ